MNKEKIDDLANFIWEGGLHLADIKGSVEQWLEQNPQKPVAVGLTDEQVADAFASPYIPKDIRDDLIVIFKNWLKTQTFAVREIPVGLSDEQIQSLVDYTYCDSDTFNTIKEWAKTQTLSTESKMKFEIYWDDAPAGAEIYQLSYVWLDKGGKWLDGNVLDEIKRPAPPAQKVEVGQVWRHINMGFAVTVVDVEYGIEFLFVEDENLHGDVDTVDNFLAKFERVGGSE